MRLDLTCPLELAGFEILHDDRGAARAQARIVNLTGRRIAWIEAVAEWVRLDTGGTAAMPFRLEGIVPDTRREFEITLHENSLPFADALRLHVSRARFQDGGEEWIKCAEREIAITDPPALDPAAKGRLLRLAGGDAVCHAEDMGSCWRCVCGHHNAPEARSCGRCRRLRDDALMRFTSRAIDEAWALGDRGACFAEAPEPLDDTPLQQRRDQRRQALCRRRIARRRAARLRFGAFCAAAAAVAAALIIIL